ncbi:unnamed protein product [Schistosoma margrebowiei]|uniref:Fucosyltransferase n=1 Tax=Schistosoma margrebowiei TaxID=48269 RepID=A0AA84ZA48_9TREM|nr:unnamed protein product [Schistosoma margrebowiei]
MRRVRRLVVLAVQLAVIVCTSYQLTKLLSQFKWEEQFGLSRNDDGFSYNELPREIHSSSVGNLNQTYYTASQMKKYENKITLGFTEKDLEELYEVKSTPAARKIILNYGNLRIDIIRNFSFCFACDCELIFDRSRWLEADVIILTDHLYPKGPRPPNQLWFIFVHESPLYIRIADELGNKVNYTISYRMDSTIYVPYHNYIPFVASHGPDTKYVLPSRNYATGKSKMVAWFVSNCQPKGPRMMYGKELSRYIQVDIYGRCGILTCPREVDSQCFTLLGKHYKFYLSFENSLCPDYITEKFYGNALINNIIPVVMGASYEEYKRVAPPHSFIHVDQFESPEKLANYLKYLDRNDTAYNEYFSWYEHGTIGVWFPLPQCAICLLAHTAHKLKPYTFPNVSKWWNDACVGRKLRWKSVD